MEQPHNVVVASVYGNVFVDADWLAEQRARKTAKNQQKRQKQKRNKATKARLWEEWRANGSPVVYTEGSMP